MFGKPVKGKPAPAGYGGKVAVTIGGAQHDEAGFRALEGGLRNAFDGSTISMSRVDAVTTATRFRAAAPKEVEEELTVHFALGPMVADGRKGAAPLHAGSDDRVIRGSR